MGQVEKVIEEYLKVNDLKEKIIDNQSITSNIYGAMILLMAINSEYNFTENVGDTLIDMLLYKLNQECSYQSVELLRDRKYDLNKINYCFELDKYLNILKPSIKKIGLDSGYKLIRDKMIFDDDIKNKKILKFYYMNNILKEKSRSGWDDNHWNVLGLRESVADHVVGSMALALYLSSVFLVDVDISNVMETLCLHEVGEILIGDITPFDDVTKEEKRKIEHQAMEKVLENLVKKDEYLDKLYSFDEEKNKEFKFCHYCDKLEADIQAKVYQDKGRMNDLDNQKNNIVFNKEKTLKMIAEGATTSFDIWYLYDKDIYKDNELFTKTLEYVKTKKLR